MTQSQLMHLLRLVDDLLDISRITSRKITLEKKPRRPASDRPQRVRSGSTLTLSLPLAFDVIILDIGMPGMDGHEVARRVRATPEIPRAAKLAALTGRGSLEEQQKAEAASLDVHIVKPVEPERLRDIVHA